MEDTRSYRTWAEIDLGALRHNLAAVRRLVGREGKVMAVVKANAYGHGVRPVVQALAGGVEMFGVANATEGLEIRDLAGTIPILILGPALPEERPALLEAGFIPLLSSLKEAQAYSALAGAQRRAVHVKIDTGMGRIGLYEETCVEEIRQIAALPGLEVTGIASHFPVADEDDAYTTEQLKRFQAWADKIRPLVPAPLRHIANSAGTIGFPVAPGDLVRAGLMLYGSAPRAEFQPQLRQVVTWKTRVALVRDVPAGRGVSYGRTYITSRAMRIATLAVGYADGFQRHLSNRGAQVLIGGQRCDVLGRVTMDQIMVDITEVHAPVEEGTEAVLLGRQGEEEILAAEMATKAGSIAWEIFTGLGPRVRRIYRDDAAQPQP